MLCNDMRVAAQKGCIISGCYVRFLVIMGAGVLPSFVQATFPRITQKKWTFCNVFNQTLSLQCFLHIYLNRVQNVNGYIVLKFSKTESQITR